VQVGSQFVEVSQQRDQLGVSCGWKLHNRTCAPVQRKSSNNVVEFRSVLTYVSTRTEQAVSCSTAYIPVQVAGNSE
jgi:hypothetical protein